MLREVKASQRAVRVLGFIIDGATPALTEGKFDGTLVENSAGNYTITFAKAFARAPVVVATVATDVTTVRIVSATASAVNIEVVGADQTTPEDDANAHLLVWGFDSADQT